MITLFIGGAHDGARIEVDEARTDMRLPVIESFAMGTITVETPRGAIFDFEYYVRHTLRADKEEFSVFALNDMTPADMMRLLLVRYPKPK